MINCDAPRESKKVYITHMLCPACAKRLINLGGVIPVLYAEDTSRTGGVEMLESVGISVPKYGADSK